MPTLLIVRHVCDRCGTVEERDATTTNDVSTPDSWCLFSTGQRPRLLCGACIEGLDAFIADNNRVEQSR